MLGQNHPLGNHLNGQTIGGEGHLKGFGCVQTKTTVFLPLIGGDSWQPKNGHGPSHHAKNGWRGRIEITLLLSAKMQNSVGAICPVKDPLFRVDFGCEKVAHGTHRWGSIPLFSCPKNIHFWLEIAILLFPENTVFREGPISKGINLRKTPSPLPHLMN